MKKRKSLSWHKKKLDKIYSKYIRLKYANDEGYISCFTCNKVVHWKEAQNSHYIPRNISSTRYLDLNCHPSCVGCNVFGGGKLDVYAIRLMEKYGTVILQKLNDLKKEHKKYTIPELEELYEEYKQKVKAL